MVFDDLKEIRHLGRGTFGEVVLAKRTSDGSFCAVKHIRKSEAGATEAKEHATEVHALKTLKHPFILRIFGASEDEHTFSIVTEYADAGDLQQLLKKYQEAGQHFDGMEMLSIFAQLTSAVSHVHGAHIMHRDLKPSNVLLTTFGCLKLGDFGVAKVLAGTTCCDQLTCVGSPTYMAPEIVGGEPYGPPCDMWSLGVMLYELYTFQKPFEGRSLGELVMRIASGSYRPVSDVMTQPRDAAFAERVGELVGVMLRTNFRVRAKVGDVARHELLRYLVASLRSCVAVLAAVLRRISKQQSGDDETSLLAELDQASVVVPVAGGDRGIIGRSTSGGSAVSVSGSATMEGTVVRNRPPRTPGVRGTATPPEPDGTQRLLESSGLSRSASGDSLALSDTQLSFSLTATGTALGFRTQSNSLLGLTGSRCEGLEEGILAGALEKGDEGGTIVVPAPPLGHADGSADTISSHATLLGGDVPADTIMSPGPLLAESMDTAGLAAVLGREVEGADGSVGRTSTLSGSSLQRAAAQLGESLMNQSPGKAEGAGTLRSKRKGVTMAQGAESHGSPVGPDPEVAAVLGGTSEPSPIHLLHSTSRSPGRSDDGGGEAAAGEPERGAMASSAPRSFGAHPGTSAGSQARRKAPHTLSPSSSSGELQEGRARAPSFGGSLVGAARSLMGSAGFASQSTPAGGGVQRRDSGSDPDKSATWPHADALRPSQDESPPWSTPPGRKPTTPESQGPARNDRQPRRRENAAVSWSASDSPKVEPPATFSEDQRQKQPQRDRLRRHGGGRPVEHAGSVSAPPSQFRRPSNHSPRASQSPSPEVADPRAWRKQASGPSAAAPLGSPSGGGSAANATSSTGLGRFRPGQKVGIHGLRMSTELNGTAGILQHFERDRGRWIVRFADTGDERALKPENLSEAEAPDAARAGSKTPSPPAGSASPRVQMSSSAGIGTGSLPGNVRLSKGSLSSAHRRSVSAMQAGLQPPPSQSLGRLLPQRSAGGATPSRPSSRGRLRVA